MVELKHAYKTYRDSVHALRDINLKIDKGEFIFVTGPSGAGKTTLFKLLSGYDRPSSGRVDVFGYSVGDLNRDTLPLFRRRIGVIYQDFRLLKAKTVFENVALPLEVRGERHKLIAAKVHEMLDHVSLRHKRDALPEYLSGGEQQRVAIARALVHQPNLLIADEPTGNLDPELSQEIIDLLEKVNAQGTTVVVATHDHEMVKNRGRRRIELKEGLLVGSP